MIKHSLNSRLVVCGLMLCIMLGFLATLSIPAYAYSLTDTKIGVTGDDGWTVNGTAISGSISGSTSSAITIKNNNSDTAVLTFEYTGDLTSGNSSAANGNCGSAIIKKTIGQTTAEVKNHTLYNAKAWNSSSGSYNGNVKVELGAGDSVSITLKGTQESGFGKIASKASISITNILLKVKTTANVSFVPDSTVSYTVGYVDGNGAAQTASVTAGGTSNVTVEAELSEGITITPASGYICESAVGSTSGTVYADKNGEFTFAKNETVTPAFLSSSADMPFTHLGVSKSYATLGAAVNAGSGTVVLNQDYTLPAGNYTIPYGVTLLIPCDDANTVYTTEPGKEASDTYHETSEYRKLTMANGAKITVGGAISLGGKIGNNMTGGVVDTKYNYTNGAPSGPLGYIDMAGGSSITVSSGGNLYAWGFVTGSGSVTVKNGGTVYEDLQIRDWRGGNCTVSVHDKRGTYRAFPFNQYYIQNIEVPLTMEAGATENVCVAMSITLVGVVVQENATFIGRNSGLIQMSSGSLTRTYDGSKDRIIYDLNGNISLANLNISIRTSITGTITINSSEYVMPITSNMTLNANKGSAVTVAQDFALLPGAEVNIMNGATVTLSKDKRIYVYDATEWGNYSGAGNTKLSPVFYAPSKAYTRTASDLTDGKVVVNGTLDASASYLYSTVSGGNIISDGGGVVKTAKGTETVTYQISQSGRTPSFPEISITPVMLKHGDGTYAITANSTTNPNTYTYTDGKWVCTTHTEEETIQTPAACETAGVKTVTCKVCGTTRTEEIPALTHKDENPKDHICDNNCGKSDMGTHADGDDNNHTCDYCEGAVEGEECVDADSNHKCDECGETTSSCVDANPKDHVCDYTGCQATMGDHKNGTNTHTCEYCGQAASTCSDIDTDSDHNCDVCGAAVGGHSYGEWETTKEATCATTGSKQQTCNCGDVVTEEIPATNNHSDSEEDQDHICDTCDKVMSDCSDIDTDSDHNCDVCGAAVGGHSYTATVTYPTCTEPGYTTYTCDCGDTYVAEEVAASGHTYGVPAYNWEGTELTVTLTCDKCEEGTENKVLTGNAQGEVKSSTEGDCQTKATVTYTATVPLNGKDYTYETTIDGELGEHNLVVTEAKEATCTTPGNNEYYTCSVEGCGKVFKADKTTETTVDAETIQTTNHTPGEPVEKNRVEATATENGSYDLVVYCSVCKTHEISRKTVVIPAAGAPVEVKIDDKTKGAATITEPAGGWHYGEENTFTVTYDKSCVVVVKDADGNYTRLPASGDGNTKSYTVTLEEGMELVVAIKGDMDGNGKIRIADVIALAQAEATGDYSSYSMLIGDMDENNKIRIADVIALAQLEAQG